VGTDYDPLFRFRRWLANLRIRKIEEIKLVPYAPVSHAFAERAIGTIRRELLDRAFFWNATDLERKLADFRAHFNARRVHRGLAGAAPTVSAGDSSVDRPSLENFGWKTHCRGLSQLPAQA